MLKIGGQFNSCGLKPVPHLTGKYSFLNPVFVNYITSNITIASVFSQNNVRPCDTRNPAYRELASVFLQNNASLDPRAKILSE